MKDCDEPLLEEGPKPGSRWGMVFDGALLNLKLVRVRLTFYALIEFLGI